jgi:MoaA/NifB/PqqE/SkfB family radical SAM enzyme
VLNIPVTLSNEVLAMAGKLSRPMLLRAVGMLEGLASIKWHRQGFEQVKRLINENHGSVEAVRRILKQTNPRVRAAILNNFILGSLLIGYRKRFDFYKRHGNAPPGTLMISPTLRCNLRCYGCYAATHDRGEDLTFEEVDGVLTDAAAAGCNFIVVLGGEPFMVPWLLDMVAKHSQMAFLIYTNGILLDEERIQRLARLGNAGIAIGIDGLAKDTDERKGPGAFDRAMANLRRLSRAGVLTGISAMTSRHNFEVLHSDAFFDTIIENGAGFAWVTIAVPQGSANQDPDIIPTAEQKARIPGLLGDLRRRKPILIVDHLTDSTITEGCGAARILWHINANGDVEPCVLMPFAVDNIREKPFRDIMRSDFFEQIRSISQRHRGEQQTCMMVYRPKEVLAAVQACGARTTSKGTMEALHDLAREQK